MSETHFDAVIVGSGFGGSVMACRLAEAGLRVCILERGQAFPPGSFPRSPHAVKRNFWDPSEGLYGLFNIWSFRDIKALVTSGLGGGSLTYANVLLRKDERWFIKEEPGFEGYEYWPVTREELDPYYERAERMLNAQQYPLHDAPYNKTSKTLALKGVAEQLKLDWFLPNLAVTFQNEGEAPQIGEPIREEFPNLHHKTRYTCRLCGECDLGCNYGSKNTLDYTYLTMAQRKGADLRTLCEVRAFEPIEGGYAIQYVQHNLEHAEQKRDTHNPEVLPLHMITAPRLILSAGTFGTTYLLLRNHSAFPHLSNKLGSQFSGNGDLINFVVRCSDKSVDTRIPRMIDASNGPVITSAIRYPDHADGGKQRGFYIEDAGYPELVNWMLQIFDMTNAIRPTMKLAHLSVQKFLKHKSQTDISKFISALFGGCELSSGLLPLLGMGRDLPNGQMYMSGGNLDLRWQEHQSNEYFEALRGAMREIANELGGTFIDDPLWYFRRVVSAHPLGGCPMGRNEDEGVVNDTGEVFNYPNLYIADGSIMPGAVGANPSLTIAALAERIAAHITKEDK